MSPPVLSLSKGELAPFDFAQDMPFDLAQDERALMAARFVPWNQRPRTGKI